MFWFSWLNEIEPETLCNNEFFCCKSSSNFAVPISSCSLISNTEKNKLKKIIPEKKPKKKSPRKINKIMLRFLDQSMFMKWCKNVKKMVNNVKLLKIWDACEKKWKKKICDEKIRKIQT